MPRRIVDLASLQPERVCLIKPSSLGDVVHALPVLSAVRNAWPQAHIAWIVNQGLRGLLDGHPQLDEVIPFDRAKVGLSPSGIAAFLRFSRSLRQKQFDLAIDLQGLFRSGVMTAATGAKVRVGLASAREGAPWFYTHRVEVPQSTTHAVDRLMEVVRAFGINAAPEFQPSISEADRAHAAFALRAVSSPRIVLNLGARWLTKRWPPSQFAAVAKLATAERGAGLVAVGAPEDTPLVAELTRLLGDIPVLDLTGKTSLVQLAAIMESADCVISNDSGPLHLAAATGVPVVGIYTCTSPAKTGPYGPNAVAVASQVWCAGSCVKTCDRLECFAELTPERVWAAASKLMERSNRAPHAA